MQPVSTHDPRQHIAPIKASLVALVDRLRDAERTVDEPRAQALFEMTADVLGGLIATYDHYERANEPAQQATPLQG